jgi:hypothetical protein
VLLLLYGYARPWYERHAPEAPLAPLARPAWPPKRTFEPQRMVANRRVKWLAAAALATTIVLAIALVVAASG